MDFKSHFVVHIKLSFKPQSKVIKTFLQGYKTELPAFGREYLILNGDVGTVYENFFKEMGKLKAFLFQMHLKLGNKLRAGRLLLRVS